MYVKLEALNQGVNEVVAAPGENKRIMVMGIFFQCTASTMVKIRSGLTAAGDMTGGMQFSTGGGLNLPYSGLAHFECQPNEPFCFDVDGMSAACAGGIHYILEDVG